MDRAAAVLCWKSYLYTAAAAPPPPPPTTTTTTAAAVAAAAVLTLSSSLCRSSQIQSMHIQCKCNIQCFFCIKNVSVFTAWQLVLLFHTVTIFLE
jgi:hypothetical protein